MTTSSPAAARCARGGGNIRVDRCLFVDNIAPVGAAISTREGNMEITNSIFTGNRSLRSGEGGGVLAARDAVTTVTHCTLYDNTTDKQGDVFRIRGADHFMLRNSILQNNGGTAVYATNSSPAHIAITHSLFHGFDVDLNSATYLADYTGTISTQAILGGAPGVQSDPLFESLPARDFLLRDGSPAIDTRAPSDPARLPSAAATC